MDEKEDDQFSRLRRTHSLHRRRVEQLFLPPQPLIAIGEEERRLVRRTHWKFGGRASDGMAMATVAALRTPHSPRYDDDEVHDVPRIPQVTPLVTDEAVGQDLDRHLHGEDAHEHGLELLLQ